MTTPGELYIIVNLYSDEWNSSVLTWDAKNDGAPIPESQRPTFIHYSKENAEVECLRLAKEHGGEFVIFKAVMFADFVDARPDVWRLENIEEEVSNA